MKIKIEFNQISIINFLIAEISITAIKFYIVQSIPGLYVYNSIANVFISVILILFLAPAFMTVLKRNPFFVVETIVLFLMTLCAQLVLFPENMSTVIAYIPKIVGMSLGGLIAAYGLTDYTLFYKKLIKVSRIIIVFATLQFVAYEFFNVRGAEQLEYDMSFGFFLVVPVVTLFSYVLEDEKKGKIKNLLLVLWGVLMAVIMGSRGPILAMFVGMLLCYLAKTDVKRIKDFIILSCSGVSAVLFFVFYKDIALVLYKYLQSKNLDSRLLLMLISGNISSTTGRESLQERVKGLILEHPLIGNGMLCDLSSHNIFIEAMLFFGIPLGIIISIFVIYQWSKVFLVRENIKRIIMIIFFSYASVDSLLNLTVLGKDMFWIYLGLALSTKGIFKQKKT